MNTTLHQQHIELRNYQSMMQCSTKDIWFIDNNELYRFLVADLVTETNYAKRVVFFDGGEAALKACDKCMPKLIFLDLFMDGIDGWETLEELKRLNYKGKVAIVTSSPNKDFEHRALLNPMVIDITVKPTSKEFFLNAIKKANIT